MIRALGTTLVLVFAIGSTSSAVAGTPEVGEPAPGFELEDQNGDTHSLEDYRDSWVALYFYPGDDTPGCIVEACEFRDDILEYRRLGARVLGISLDDADSHKRFAQKYDLPFPLLADVQGVTARLYGVRSRIFGTTLARRHTFLIDPHGKIARHYADVDPENHSAQILADLTVLTAAAPDRSPDGSE